MSRRSGRSNGEWQTPAANDGFNWQHVEVEVLMDIREELRTLNATLACSRVYKMADAMVRAEKRLAKHMPLKPRKPKP